MTYRQIPEDEPQREREHHPVCAWCMHEWVGESGTRWCDSYPLRHFDDMAAFRNAGGECDGYRPSMWTRALQLVRIRPFVERCAIVLP